MFPNGMPSGSWRRFSDARISLMAEILDVGKPKCHCKTAGTAGNPRVFDFGVWAFSSHGCWDADDLPSSLAELQKLTDHTFGMTLSAAVPE